MCASEGVGACACYARMCSCNLFVLARFCRGSWIDASVCPSGGFVLSLSLSPSPSLSPQSFSLFYFYLSLSLDSFLSKYLYPSISSSPPRAQASLCIALSHGGGFALEPLEEVAQLGTESRGLHHKRGVVFLLLARAHSFSLSLPPSLSLSYSTTHTILHQKDAMIY